MTAEDSLRRVVITHVTPEVDGGRFAVKRVSGESVAVDADIFLDGQDEISCEVQFSGPSGANWEASAMAELGNDHWRAAFPVTELGQYRYRIEAWPDPFKSWRRDLQKRIDSGQGVEVELIAGAQLVREAAERATGADKSRLLDRAGALEKEWGVELRSGVAFEDGLADLMAQYPDRSRSTLYDRGQAIAVDPVKARFGAWYELFPRSASPDPRRSGTFADVIARLPYVSSLGFDVLYLPPIHPIGHTGRKGKNNTTEAAAGEPGSPWAIGSELGGHKAVNPDLGTLADFGRLVSSARDYGIDIALDLAFQCSPDHPYVREHPEWFAQRPDGSIRYAENPPKKYQDIYPLDFETADWRALWDEVLSVVEYWIEQGVRIFRVDNPHTKPFVFWEWLIGTVKARYPDTLFLSESFTRPNVMYHLAKLGFSQSYTYFTWRNSRAELTDYFIELTTTDAKEFFRPNLWPNTPDILHACLQQGGRPAFVVRFVLAATLGASYGIYGPAFELCVNEPREPDSEEYRDSEKYEVKHWDLDRSDSLRQVISRVNEARRDNPCLQTNAGLRFHDTDNENLIAYSKAAGSEDVVLTVVNLDPHQEQSGWVDLPLSDLGLNDREPFQVHDLLGGGRYTWTGSRNFVRLDPALLSAHIFRIRRRQSSERNFDYSG